MFCLKIDVFNYSLTFIDIIQKKAGLNSVCMSTGTTIPIKKKPIIKKINQIQHPREDLVCHNIESKLKLFQKTYAVLTLQKFYRHLIKWDRGEDLKPIDPIMQDEEGFDRSLQIRILYTTRIGNTNQYATRLHLYNIETLFESIKCANGNVAVNPLTNTKFTKQQFTKILHKAIEHSLMPASEFNKYLNIYGYQYGKNQNSGCQCGECTGGGDAVSSYEIADTDLAREKQKTEREQHLLAYYALLNDLDRVEKLVYRNLEKINNDNFLISFIRDPKKQFPAVDSTNLEETQKHGTMWYINQICQHIGNQGDKQTIINSQLNTQVQEPSSEKDIYDDELSLDSELETSLLPEYLKNGYTAIQACCIHGNVDMLLFLLQFGGDLSSADSKTNLLPVHIALLSKQLPLLKILVGYGAGEQLEQESKYGTPMEIASQIVSDYPEVYGVLYGTSEMIV